MNGIEWGEYKWQRYTLPEIFEMTNTKSIAQENITFGSGETPYVTAAATNNGVLTHISCPDEWLEKGHCIMIGGKTLTFTYQEKDFCSNDSHNIALYVRDKKMETKACFMFLIAALRASLNNRYSWGSSISMKKIRQEYFFLPVTNGKINITLMENFIAELEAERIAELEAERIAELEAYLQAAGLANTRLTDGEAALLSGGDLPNIEQQEFFLGDLFDLKANPQLFGNYLVRDFEDVFKKTKISLPVRNGKIDFAFMEKFITAVQKTIIAGVVAFADKKIAAAKQATGRS